MVPHREPLRGIDQYVGDRHPNTYSASAMPEGDRENSCGAGQNISSAKATV